MAHETQVFITAHRNSDDDNTRISDALKAFADAHEKAAAFEQVTTIDQPYLIGIPQPAWVGMVNHLDQYLLFDTLIKAAQHPEWKSLFAPLVVVLDDGDIITIRTLNSQGTWVRSLLT